MVAGVAPHMEGTMVDLLLIPLPLLRVNTVWEYFTRNAFGITVEGDPNLAPTRWWRKLFFRMDDNMLAAVFAPRPAERLHGYRIGIMRNSGVAMISSRWYQQQYFAIRLDREPATVFVTDPTGTQEGTVTLVERRSLASVQADGILVAPF